MFGLIKNQIKTKIGIVLPASYPASRVSLTGGGNVQDALDEITTADTGYSFENGTDYSIIQTVYSNSITKMGKLGFVSFGIALRSGLSHSVSYNIFDFPSGLEPASNLSVLAKSTDNSYTVSIDTSGKLTIVSFENVSSMQNVAVSFVYPIQ